MQDVQNLPIDINANKLLEWLISRRHCIREWSNSVLPVREKINNAIQDMPAHEGITKLLSGTYINYFHCQKIIEILKETEKESKNFLGRYGSQRMKDWQEVLRLYEKDNIYLAEAAQMLARNVNYEIPSMRRQITKCEQTQDECDKKEAECVKAVASIRHDFESSCKQLGISGNGDIKRQLVGLVSQLPAILEKVAKLVPPTLPAQKHYEDFASFALSRPEKWTPILSYVAEHGNTTTYEYTYGEPPLKIEEPPLDVHLDEPSLEEIDFGNDIDFGGDTEAIDFGGDEIELAPAGDIDWGGIEAAPDSSTIAHGEINFDVSLDDAGITLEEAGHEGGVASGSDALTILDNPRTRGALLDEITELTAFLKVRIHQTNDQSGGSVTTLSQMSGAPQDLSVGAVTEMLKKVEAVQDALLESRAQHLHSIKNSPRYVDQLAAKLSQKLSLVDKTEIRRGAVKTRRDEAAAEAAQLKPQLKLIIEKTRQLQHEIEQDISKKYKGRPVNIMGGGNILS